MPDYKPTKTSYTEDLSVKILKQLGISAKRNNTTNIIAVDLVTDINNIKIDVQYSQDFTTLWRFKIRFCFCIFKRSICERVFKYSYL